MYNGHGDVTALIDAVSGEFTGMYYYDAFGNQTNEFIYGDVDGNGSYNSDDYAYIRQYLVGMISNFPSDTGRIAADVDGDGKITGDDYAYARQMLIGMITCFPADRNEDNLVNDSSMIGYAGYFYDGETGLYYLNARMYDPTTARFLQEDTYTGTADDPLSLNLYTYCHNEPLMYEDPSGHIAVNINGMSFYTNPNEDQDFMHFAYKYSSSSGKYTQADRDDYVNTYDLGKASQVLSKDLEEYRNLSNSYNNGFDLSKSGLFTDQLSKNVKNSIIGRLNELRSKILSNKISVEDDEIGDYIYMMAYGIVSPEYVDFLDQKLHSNSWYDEAINYPELGRTYPNNSRYNGMSRKKQDLLYEYDNSSNTLSKVVNGAKYSARCFYETGATFNGVWEQILYERTKDPEMASIGANMITGIYGGVFVDGAFSGANAIRKAVKGIGAGGKTIDIVEFRRMIDGDIPADLPQAAYGHVGFSFNNGKKIYGFGPNIPKSMTAEEAHSLLMARKPFPGIVTNDTRMFQNAANYGLDVKKTTFNVSTTQYWKAKAGLTKDLFMQKVFGGISNKYYTFPPSRKTNLPWGENCYNCATYPQSLGLPTTHASGFLNE
jgi:RHS repeat-associated protein